MPPTLKIPVSLEFFPPKTAEGVEKLRVVRQQLYALKPDFCSVTFGAPLALAVGEDRKLFLERARAAVIALRDV